MVKLIPTLAALIIVGGSCAFAQDAAPGGMAALNVVLSPAAAARHPQPVRVGALVGRQVLRHLASQPTLGRVLDLVKRPDGSVEAVIDYGGVFGFFRRPIAVPLDAMTVLGQYMEIPDLKPEELDRYPTFEASGTQALPRDGIVLVALGHPAH